MTDINNDIRTWVLVPAPVGKLPSTAKGPASGIQPMTDTYTDRAGRAIRLWRHSKHGLVASVVSPAGKIFVIDGTKIHNGLNPVETGHGLLKRLSGALSSTWNLVYLEQTEEIHVWPALRAAAKNRDNFTISTSLNPFKNRTAEQCAEMLKNKGFVLQHTTPTGGQAFYNPNTGRRAYLDPGRAYGSRHEGPHIDMSYAVPIKQTLPLLDHKGRLQYDASGEIIQDPRERIIEKKKFPLRPGDDGWAKMVNKVKTRYAAHERLCGRDPSAKSLVPTLQKGGGVECALSPLQHLEVDKHLQFLIPLPSLTEDITLQDVHQVIRDLFIGIYICDEMPSLAMDPNEDGSAIISLPAPYRGTLVGDVLREVDALGKGVMQGMVFPEHARRVFAESWKAVLTVDPKTGRSTRSDYDEVLATYKAYGATNLYEDRVLGPILLTGFQPWLQIAHDVETANYTFVPIQKSLKQHESTVILDSDLMVGGSLRLHEETPLATAAAKHAHDQSAAAIRNVLLQLPDASRNIELLKLTGFMVQLLVTLRDGGLMPDLSALPAAPVVYEPEDQMPPFLKPKSQMDTRWALHGGANVDLLDVPKGALTKPEMSFLQHNNEAIVTGGQLSNSGQRYLSVPMHIVRFEKGAQEPRWMYDWIHEYSQSAADAATTDLPDETLEALQKKFASRKKEGMDEASLLIVAAQSGSSELLKMMFDTYAARCWTMFGARQGFKDLVNKTYGPCTTNIVKPAGTRMSLASLAAESGSLPALQFLVGTGAEYSEGTQPLELALLRRDKTIRQYLLSQRYYKITHHLLRAAFDASDAVVAVMCIPEILTPEVVKQQNRSGYIDWVLIEAARLGDPSLIRWLLRQKSGSINQPCFGDLESQTPLVAACESAKIEGANTLNVVQQLLARGANTRRSTVEGYTPWHVAAMHGRADIFQALFDADQGGIKAVGCIATKDGYTIIGLASKSRSLGLLQTLKLLGMPLSMPANVKTGQSITEMAKQQGDTKQLEWLSTFLKSSASHLAAEKAMMHFIGTELNAACIATSMAGDATLVRTLVENGASRDGTDEKSWPLYQAAKYGQVGVIDTLVALGASVKPRDFSGQYKPLPYSPFVVACLYGRERAVRWFLDHGVYVNEMGFGDWNVENGLLFACKLGHYNVVRLLLKEGAEHKLAELAASHNNHPKVAQLVRGYREHR